MALLSVAVRCKGTSSLVMNRASDELVLRGCVLPHGPAVRPLPREEAERKVYKVEVDGKDRFYVPATALHTALVKAGEYVRYGKLQLSNARTTHLPEVMSLEDEFVFLDTPGWQADLRTAKDPFAGEEICIVRPRFDVWGFKVTIKINAAKIEENKIRHLFDFAGQRIGLLSFRPEKGGMHGRFIVESWKHLK